MHMHVISSNPLFIHYSSEQLVQVADINDCLSRLAYLYNVYIERVEPIRINLLYRQRKFINKNAYINHLPYITR